MDEEQFARLIALRRPPTSTAGHLVEDKLALWLAADVAVTTDAQRPRHLLAGYRLRRQPIGRRRDPNRGKRPAATGCRLA